MTTVSAGFKNLSQQVGASLTTLKTDPASEAAPPTIVSEPVHSSGGSNNSSSAIYFNRKLPPQLAQKDYPDVLYWHSIEYNVKRKSGKKGAQLVMSGLLLQGRNSLGGERALKGGAMCRTEADKTSN